MICHNLSSISITKETITTTIFFQHPTQLYLSLSPQAMFSPFVSSPCHPLIFHRIAPNHLLAKLLQSFINVASSSTNSNSPKNNDEIYITHKEQNTFPHILLAHLNSLFKNNQLRFHMPNVYPFINTTYTIY